MLRKGFTLIELLVVIAIIAVLAAILFPVFAQAKTAAKQTVFLSDQNQVGLALTMYLNDWDDCYPEEHPSDANPAVDDADAQLEGTDYGSPLYDILPYFATNNPEQAAPLYPSNLNPAYAPVYSEPVYYNPNDPDPHGKTLLLSDGDCPNYTNGLPNGSDSGVPPPNPGFVTSIVLNAYYLFGMNQSQVTEPARSAYINERNNNDCDVHYHPWLGEVGDNNGNPYAVDLTSGQPNDLGVPVFAIASTRFAGGSTATYCDGHAKWHPFGAMRTPFEGHELFGEFQAF